MSSFRVNFGRPRKFKNSTIELPAEWFVQIFHYCGSQQEAIERLRESHPQGKKLLIGLVENLSEKPKGDYIIDGKEYVVNAAFNDEWEPKTNGAYIVVVKDLFSGEEVAYHCSNPSNQNEIFNIKFSFENETFTNYSNEHSQLEARSYLKKELVEIC